MHSESDAAAGIPLILMSFEEHINKEMALPPFNLDELVLVEATAEQAIITQRNTYEEWGYPQFTVDEYLQREVVLKDLDYTRENFQIWVLVPANDTKTLQVIASLIYYGIATVFTPKKYRKNGYASKLLCLLQEKLQDKSNNNNNAHFSVLYSEVGPKFYSKLGWKLYPHSDLHSDLKLRDQLPSKIPSQVKLLEDVDSLKSIIEYDCDLALKEFKQLRTSSVLILPSYPCYEWLLRRNEYRTKIDGKKQANIRGAVVVKNNKEGIEGEDILGFIIWCHDFGDKELLALRFRSDGPATTRILMNQAKLEAKKFDFNSVIVWNLDPKLFKRDEGKIVERASSLPQLALFGTGILAASAVLLLFTATSVNACEEDCRVGISHAFADKYALEIAPKFNSFNASVNKNIFKKFNVTDFVASNKVKKLKTGVLSALTKKISTLKKSFITIPERVKQPPPGVPWKESDCEKQDYICGNPPAICHFMNSIVKPRNIKNVIGSLSSKEGPFFNTLNSEIKKVTAKFVTNKNKLNGLNSALAKNLKGLLARFVKDFKAKFCSGTTCDKYDKKIKKLLFDKCY
ncbi:5620_t:CDS:2 [Entrophospora sp. SA101]|nr:5620_t:CDS:2 [Entrophospora sp. SA101]